MSIIILPNAEEWNNQITYEEQTALAQSWYDVNFAFWKDTYMWAGFNWAVNPLTFPGGVTPADDWDNTLPYAGQTPSVQAYIDIVFPVWKRLLYRSSVSELTRLPDGNGEWDNGELSTAQTQIAQDYPRLNKDAAQQIGYQVGDLGTTITLDGSTVWNVELGYANQDKEARLFVNNLIQNITPDGYTDEVIPPGPETRVLTQWWFVNAGTVEVKRTSVYNNPVTDPEWRSVKFFTVDVIVI